jgi:hypothetical protein
MLARAQQTEAPEVLHQPIGSVKMVARAIRAGRALQVQMALAQLWVPPEVLVVPALLVAPAVPEV